MQPLAPAALVDPLLHVDLTTAWQERGRIPHGTTRVERGLAGALAELEPPQVAFCRYERLRGFINVSPAEVREVIGAEMTVERRRDPPSPWRRHRLLQAGKGLERWLRDNIRAPMRRHAAAKLEPQAKPLFAPSRTLLIPGELQRHDFAVLMQLKRQCKLRLAFVFYDLLGVLPPNDPRLRDRSASDLPSSDFIVREADLVLSISEHSAKMLQAHAASRAMAMPPIKTIRLGHLVRAAPSGVFTPTGLTPANFVLSVGDIVPRKNHALLVTVWRKLLRDRESKVKPLVIAGRVGADGADLAREVAADPRLARFIKISQQCR